VLEKNRSKEFYGNMIGIKPSKNNWINNQKIRLHMVKMIASFEINKRKINKYLILTAAIIISIAIFLLLLDLKLISWWMVSVGRRGRDRMRYVLTKGFLNTTVGCMVGAEQVRKVIVHTA
jgi:hypothetical protein